MVRNMAPTPQAALARVMKSARWNSRIIEKCLGLVRCSMGITVRSLYASRGLIEKAPHLPAGVGPPWIRIRAAGAAARPGMSRAVHQPVLDHDPARRIGMNGAGVRMTARNLTALRRDIPAGRRAGDDLPA